MTKFPINNTSVLYGVIPKYKSFGSCESLTSYIMRLAKEHNILPGILISKMVTPMLKNKYILNSSINGGNRFYDGAKSLNGFDKNAVEFTQILESLTGRTDLKDTTLLEIKNLVSSRNLLKRNLAWCSMCLNTWQEEAYYPLVWFFKDINICAYHNCELKHICPYCDKNLPILHRKSLVGYCPYCKNWLVVSESKAIENDKDKELFKVQEVSTLLADRAFLAQNYDRESISGAFLELINHYANGNLAEFSRFANIPKVTLWDWVYGGRLPSLGNILDICYRINIPLMQFLSRNLQVDYQLNEKIEQKRARKILVRRKISQYELQRKLERFLKKPELSLSKVSKILGYDRKVLTSNFPKLCHLIVNQHKEYCIQQKDNRNLELVRNIDKAVNHLYESEVYPSRREVEKFLRKPGLLHERGLREEWLKKISK
ncbi:TniQ family protein [Bacillus sp. BH32]|uniref:TniQ family protein n=1 Tax=Bacillus sp. BH32 TaxID=2528961 RepID=UPI001062745A|nr:TniQ family protein [Bacillus sp. BH32]NYS75205.1 TniQ family protein [Bacillus sp. BH32]